jgi:hypothetical protein
MAEAIALIDYGAGNLHSVHNALLAAGAERVAITADPDIVRGARRVVLPGVGSFKACADGLTGIPGMVEALEERVLEDGVPFLGVCVGMQLLASEGLEHGSTPGSGWIAGEVRLIERTDPAIKVPHMGWNDVSPAPHGRDGRGADRAGRGLLPALVSLPARERARRRGDDRPRRRARRRGRARQHHRGAVPPGEEPGLRPRAAGAVSRVESVGTAAGP